MAVQFRFIAESIAAPEYNCSEHTSKEWTALYGTRRTILGIWSISFAAVCQILYIPCLQVFCRERRMTCYKIMFVLAVADLGGITCVGTLFGYAMAQGLVFCSNPPLAWVLGCGSWYVSSCNCILLVINRICELVERPWIFQGRTSSLCILATVVYGVTGMLFTRPVLPNSSVQTIAFDPFIPGHITDEYPNRSVMIHNTCVAFILPLLYALMCTVFRSNTTGIAYFQMIQQSIASSSATQSFQAKIFTQATIICFVNVFTASAWVSLMFVIPPQVVIIAAMVMVQSLHGLPCIIYLVLNRAVREELWRMVGIKPKTALKTNEFTSMNSRSRSLSTAVSSP